MFPCLTEEDDALTRHFLIICASTNHMVRANGLLLRAGITTELVPVPAVYGNICNTAIKIDAAHVATAHKLLRAKKVAVQAIVPETLDALPDLPAALADLTLTAALRTTLDKVARGEALSRQDLITLLTTSGDEQQAVLRAADMMRQAIVGQVVDVRAAVEFSNYCRKNCCYCGLRRENAVLRRYRMTPAEILATAHQARQAGVRTLILQSGEDPWYDTARLVALLRAIKAETGLRITLSLGERLPEEYRIFKDAGADNYLLKIETTNRQVFARIHPDDDFDTRKAHADILKKTGYITGSGNIVGLPGQSAADLADDIILMRQQGIHMVGIGPFLPAVNTPLAHCPPGDYDLSLKTVAVARLYLKNVFIPSTTALATLQPDGLRRGLEVGANTIMFNMTPPQYRGDYVIYSEKRLVDLERTVQAIQAAGRTVPAYIKCEGKAAENV